MGKTSITIEQAVEAAREHPAAFVSALLADSLERAARIAAVRVKSFETVLDSVQ